MLTNYLVTRRYLETYKTNMALSYTSNWMGIENTQNAFSKCFLVRGFSSPKYRADVGTTPASYPWYRGLLPSVTRIGTPTA